MSHDVIAFVPSLTRHAQTMTGSRQKAAERVRLCLEMLAVQPERLGGDDVRIDLFRAFHDLWSPGDHDVADDKLLAFPARDEKDPVGGDSLEKCVLHLAYVERFSPKSVAEILSIDERRIAEILLKKQRCLQLPVHSSALIIEDDALMAKHMNEIAQDLGLTVINVTDGVESAVCTALDQRPAVILIDIQLRKGQTGLTAARAILQRRRVPVVFVTGYPWMLELNDESDAMFVVAKPFRPPTLKAKITEVLDLYSDPVSAEICHARLLSKLRKLFDAQGGAGQESLH